MQNESHTTPKHLRKPKGRNYLRIFNFLAAACLLFMVFSRLVFPSSSSADTIRNISGSGSRSPATYLRLTREYRGGKFDSGKMESSPIGGRAVSEFNGTPSGAVDLVRLARAVAIAETGNCTRGVGITHNNCFGIRERGSFVKFDSAAHSYRSFEYNWKKHYSGFPTLLDADKWTGGDRAETWLENVKANY